jgi:hypothetical protein
VIAARTKVDAAATSQRHAVCALDGLAAMAARIDLARVHGETGSGTESGVQCAGQTKEAAMRTDAGVVGHLTAAHRCAPETRSQTMTGESKKK